MEEINLNFRMARSDGNDRILRAICMEALNYFFEHIDANKIKCILLTGSVANGEGTVIRCIPSMITSDFDFVIYLDFVYFVKNRAYFEKLSKKISLKLVERGINTHVEFLPSLSILRAIAHFTMPNIYEYEFAFASNCVFGKIPSFKKVIRPSKEDALELVFTVVSDLVFSKSRNISKTEESYIYAKRALTLLNSILIFHGFFAETYEKRMKIAKKYMSRAMFPINQDEVKILQAFNEYKLSGSFQHLLDSFACEEKDDIVKFQRKFLKKLTTKILYYELENFLEKTTKRFLSYDISFSSITRKFPILLKEYSRHSKGRLLTKIIGIIFYLFFFLTGNRKRKELFATFIFHKQPPKVILNILITLLFIYGRNVSAARILRETFPWINFNDAQAIRTMFSLWQSAEQSIKLS